MKRKEIILLALVVLLGAGAVTGGQAGGHLDEQNRVAAVEPQDIVAGQQGLGFALLKVLSSRAAGQNVFISPLSVSTAFSMACAGARGDTRAKLSQALRLPSADQAAINKGFRGLVAGIAGRSAEIAVEIADSIFVSSKYKLEPAFVQQARTFFDAEVQSLDFASAGAPARVNAWVSQKTHGKIPEIVQRINPGSVTILLNAAYFKGPWSTPFKKAATREADFHLASGSSKKVQMMRQVAFIDYLKRKDFQAVSLPYKDPRFAACIFLPDKSSSLDALRKGLSPDMWRSWMGKLSARHGQPALQGPPLCRLHFPARQELQPRCPAERALPGYVEVVDGQALGAARRACPAQVQAQVFDLSQGGDDRAWRRRSLRPGESGFFGNARPAAAAFHKRGQAQDLPERGRVRHRVRRRNRDCHDGSLGDGAGGGVPRDR